MILFKQFKYGDTYPSQYLVVCTLVVMATVFIYTMMYAILLLYSCCDRTVMKGNFRKHYQCVKCSILYITHTVEGRVTTTLPEVAAVCNGNQLELNCTITGSLLQWKIIPWQNKTVHSQLSDLMHSPIRNRSLQYGDSTITYTIISHPMELTLYRIVISPITNNLNGAKVKCTDFEDQESSSTVIDVVNEQGNVI